MELDQLLFKKVFNYFSKQKKNRSSESPNVVELETISPKLTIVACALTGQRVEIVASEREGGWKDNLFYLPSKVDLFNSSEKNVTFYLYRIFYLRSQQGLNQNWHSGENKSTTESQEEASSNSSVVLKHLAQEFPNVGDLHDKLKGEYESQAQDLQGESLDLTYFYGRWMKNTQQYDNKVALSQFDADVIQNNVKADTEIKANHADEIEVLTLDKKAQSDYVLTHNFEKVETLDEADGMWRDFDGDDTLKEDEQALNDLNIRHVVRVDDPVHSVYQSDMVGNAHIPTSATLQSNNYHLNYPEWNYKEGSYLHDYCKVFPSILTTTDAAYYQSTMLHNRNILNELRKVFARIYNDREEVKRLTSGENVDLEALVDLKADILAQCTPDERLYSSKRRKKKELSILFLLDLSLSSDGYTKGNRIIDIEKQVSILFGEVLNEYGIDFQIDGFYSKTRNHTDYVTLKAFDSSWSSSQLSIGSAQPQGYTRIGPALRHATAIIQKRKMRKKWIILLSDGKPNDYDRYEGTYGIQDIKQSLREMNHEGINNFAVAIEEEARYYLPVMFGSNHYNILSSPVEMIRALSKLFRRIEIG